MLFLEVASVTGYKGIKMLFIETYKVKFTPPVCEWDIPIKLNIKRGVGTPHCT